MPILHLVTPALLPHPAQDLATRALVTLVLATLVASALHPETLALLQDPAPVLAAQDLVLATVVAHRPGLLLRSRQARRPALALARQVFLLQLLATSLSAIGHLPQVL